MPAIAQQAQGGCWELAADGRAVGDADQRLVFGVDRIEAWSAVCLDKATKNRSSWIGDTFQNGSSPHSGDGPLRHQPLVLPMRRRRERLLRGIELLRQDVDRT